jgi:hypothetical protein
VAHQQKNRVVYHVDAELLGLHICSELCWCNPVQIRRGLWEHFDYLVEGTA